MANPPIKLSNKNLTIKTYITKPDAKYHFIEDNDLENIMRIGCPKSLLVCTSCIGYVLGEARTIIDISTKFFAKDENGISLPFTLSGGDFFYIFLLIAAVSTAFITGLYAYGGKSEISKTLAKIRARPPIQLKS